MIPTTAVLLVLATTTCFSHVAASEKADSLWLDIPVAKMSTSEIIRYQGYPVENHRVVTQDGYILNLQRIPYGKKGSRSRKAVPVLLQHGLLDSSATWIINLPKQSLGYILADAGYDVWLANSRGNIYSNKHIKYSTKDSQYWDFSFEEMARYDLPACIDYILKKTNSTQLNYVGHSQVICNSVNAP